MPLSRYIDYTIAARETRRPTGIKHSASICIGTCAHISIAGNEKTENIAKNGAVHAEIANTQTQVNDFTAHMKHK